MTVLNDTAAGIASDVSRFTFNTYDYIVFLLMLSISAGIGAYFGFFAKSADTTDEYLMGGRRMKTLPIAISLVASQLSGISIMTIPAETYMYGVNWFFNVTSMVVIVPILGWVIIPVFYNNNMSNCYEYLELRFNKETRTLLTVSFITTIFAVLPIYIFIPSLAFAQVTGINIHLINTIVCSICVFYTMVGGIKAVVWTDVVQASIMLLSVVAVGVLGAMKVGGFGEVIKIATEGGRLTPDFTFDLTTRSTFWNNSIASVVMWTSYTGLNQSCVQRIVSLPTLGHAKRSLVLFGIGFLIVMFFNCFTGVIMYARFQHCDPIQAGFVSKADKLMPYFVQDVVGHLKGMPGVFISCVFSAALSTLSASLNSLCGVVYFDYIKPHIQHTEHKANVIMKIMVFVCGIYCIIGGVAVASFASILQLVFTIGGVTFGAVFGVFMLGMLVPRAHGRAAFWSVIASIAGMFIIITGGYGHIYQPLPTSTESCSILSTVATNSSAFMSTATDVDPAKGFNIFDISFNWYAVIGAILVFAFGIPLSYLLPPAKGEKFHPRLLSPVVQRFVNYELTHVEDESADLKLKPSLQH